MGRGGRANAMLYRLTDLFDVDQVQRILIRLELFDEADSTLVKRLVKLTVVNKLGDVTISNLPFPRVYL